MEKQSQPAEATPPESAVSGKATSPLTGEAQLVLMTYPAQRLLHGRDAPGAEAKGVPVIIGLFKFASMMRVIWNAAATGNPYADWWLLRVERERVQAEQALFALEQRIDRIYERAPAEIELRPARAVTPLKAQLSFSTPYAYLGAYLLGKFDRLVRRVLTARHVGLLDGPGADNFLASAGRLLRRFYLSATGFRPMELNRADIDADNEKAHRARERMGEIPPDILSGRIYAALHPKSTGKNREERDPLPPADTPTQEKGAQSEQEPDKQEPPTPAEQGNEPAELKAQGQTGGKHAN